MPQNLCCWIGFSLISVILYLVKYSFCWFIDSFCLLRVFSTFKKLVICPSCIQISFHYLFRVWVTTFVIPKHLSNREALLKVHNIWFFYSEEVLAIHPFTSLRTIIFGCFILLSHHPMLRLSHPSSCSIVMLWYVVKLSDII